MAFIGAIFLLSLIPSVMYFPASRLLLNPDAVTEAILASDLTEEIPSLVAGALQSSPELAQLSGNAFLDRLDRDDYREILAWIAPPEWITIQLAVLARQAQDFFLGRSAAATFSLDLSEVKVRLAGEAAPQVAEIIVSSWEGCSTDQMLLFGLAIAAGSPQSAYPVCQPPDEFRSMVLSIAESAVRQFAAQIPQGVRFEAANQLTGSAELTTLRFAVQVWRWRPWLALGLALVLLVVAGGSLRSGLLAIVIPLSLAGMINFGLALVFVSLRDSVVLPWLAGWMQWLYPTGLAALLTPAIASLIGRFLLSALIWSGAAVLAGAVLIVVSRVAKR